MHLGVLVSADGSYDAHFQRAVKQGNAQVAAVTPLFRDAYLTVRIKRLLLLTALRPCLEYASDVLVPTTQSRALEAVELKAARRYLGCPTLIGSEAVREDLDLPLLNSRRDVAKLKWQHRLHALPASRFESFLYSQEVPRGVRGRQRRLFGQVCDDIWSSLVSFREMRLLRRTLRLSLLLSRLSRRGTPHSLRGPSQPSLGLDCTTVSLRVQVSRSNYADTPMGTARLILGFSSVPAPPCSHITALTTLTRLPTRNPARLVTGRKSWRMCYISCLFVQIM